MTSPMAAEVTILQADGGEITTQGDVVVTREGVDPEAVVLRIGDAHVYVRESALRLALALT